MSNSVHISNQTTQRCVFVCVCVCLATGFLTLQVQLPVLRPHLRWGITAYYSSTNSLSTHQPAGRQTPAAAEGVRGVALAPGCANSRLLTFYRWLIHYLDNSSPPARCPQLFSLSFRPCLSLCLPFFVCLSFSGVLYSFLNLFFPSPIFSSVETQPVWVCLSVLFLFLTVDTFTRRCYSRCHLFLLTCCHRLKFCMIKVMQKTLFNFLQAPLCSPEKALKMYPPHWNTFTKTDLSPQFSKHNFIPFRLMILILHFCHVPAPIPVQIAPPEHPWDIQLPSSHLPGALIRLISTATGISSSW